MSKKKKKSSPAKPQQVANEKVTEPEVAPVQTDAKVEPAEKGKNKVVEVKAGDVNKKSKKAKVKKPNKIAKALKDTGGELKKVTWPKFKEVVKQTGIVLVVVLVFTLLIFGLDRLCSWLTGFLY